MTHRAPDTPPATQVERPWRATFRTVIAATWGLIPILPAIAATSDIETIPAVATAITVSAAVTRVAALPAVEAWLEKYLPWLAADPNRKGDYDLHI